MNSEPSVMMNDGNFVVTTSSPLRNPDDQGDHDRQRNGRPQRPTKSAGRVGVTRIMITMPENPRSEPIDRSNSPPIISSDTAMASIPSGAARLRIAAVVVQLTKLLSDATMAKNAQTTTVATMAPNSGRISSRVNGLTFLTRSSAASGWSSLRGHTGTSLPVVDPQRTGARRMRAPVVTVST